MPSFRVVVLASGTGTLFAALANTADDLGIEIVELITDANVPACELAKSFDIPVQVIPMQNDRAKWDQELATELSRLKPNLVISAGFMRILGPTVLRFFQGKVINTHPALLPSFPGAHAVRDALNSKATQTGATVHFVDAGVDTGEIIAQETVMVDPDDTESSLHERIKVVERQLLVRVVDDIVQGRVALR